MPPPRFLPLLALAAACATSGAREPFDPGRRVHLLVHARPAAKAPVEVAPVFTVGTHAFHATPVTIPPGGEAVEVGFLDVPSAEHHVSVYEPRSGAHGSASAEFRHEAWVVLQIDPATGRSRVGVFFEPPHDTIGAFRPLPVGAR